MTKFAANSTVDVVKKASASFEEESDTWLARRAATGNLKFIEGILKATPNNEDLMVIIGKNYGLYAFAFLQADLEQLEDLTPEYEEMRARTVNFFGRCRYYATMRMNVDYEDFGTAIRAKTDARLDQILADLDDEDHIAPMYWLAYSWGSMIGLSTDDPSMVADLGRVKKIMAWVRDRQPGFENGGPHLFFGAVELALPPALGGRAEESRAAFEAGIAVTDGKFLMGKAMFAHTYHVAVNDRAGYERLLREVIDAPSDIMPSHRLANELAKERARRFLSEIDDHFDAPEGGSTPPHAAPGETEEPGDLE